MPDVRNQQVKSYWNSRAELGPAAGTQDLIAKQLEIEAIARHITDDMRVLDIGCGNGVTAVELATRYDINVVGFDNAERMIGAAKELASLKALKGSVEFMVGNVMNIPDHLRDFDIAYSERVLINLPDWQAQMESISNILRLVRTGGKYVMCENSLDGLQRINAVRLQAGLTEITPPWHNCYIRDAEVEEFAPADAVLERKEQFSSTYYFLSRVVNAWLAKQEGKEPSYDAAVNKLALGLESFGDLGQTCIWLWRKIS